MRVCLRVGAATQCIGIVFKQRFFFGSSCSLPCGVSEGRSECMYVVGVVVIAGASKHQLIGVSFCKRELVNVWSREIAEDI